MKIQPHQQHTLATRPANVRRWLWLGLGMIGIVAGLTMYFYAMPVRDPQAQPSQPLQVQPQAVDPATQGVSDYLRAHASAAKTVVPDPAVQGMNDYLRAHASVSHPVAIDPATQSVMNYLRAHDRVERSPGFWDQATQAVLDYLRAHSR
jgi:hypothetical protein